MTDEDEREKLAALLASTQLRQLTLHLSSDDANSWTETYVEGERASFPIGSDPVAWATDLVTSFNAGLRPGERPRHIVRTDVEPFFGQANREHSWEKTNLVTIISGGRPYDTARCSVCGITAKRFGLGEHVRDPKFSAEKFRYCT